MTDLAKVQKKKRKINVAGYLFIYSSGNALLLLIYFIPDFLYSKEQPA